MNGPVYGTANDTLNEMAECDGARDAKWNDE